MGKVTAVGMDTITESSGHQMTGMAVSVCTTPAAPAPLPLPYPTMGTVSEGIIDSCMRTKIAGAKILTVGGCLKSCHGNEPGTLKEVVSLNTGGPSFPILGAPVVLIELGMAGITGSIGQMNKAITVGAGANAGDAGGDGSGGGDAGGGGDGGGDGGSKGPGNGGGDGGGDNEGAAPPDAPAPPGTEGQAEAGHPVDIVTGAMYTSAAVDFQLPGPLPMRWIRQYRTSAVRRNCGIGWGWSHSYAFRTEPSRVGVEVIDSEGAVVWFPRVADGEVATAAYGRRLSRRGGDLVLATGDDEERILRRDDAGVHRLVEVRDRSGNTVEIEHEGGEVSAVIDSVGRRVERERFPGGERWTFVLQGDGGEVHRVRAVTYEYDGRGDLVRAMDVGGAVTEYRYDEDHFLVEERLPSGIVYRFRYEDGPDRKRRCVETWGEIPGRDILAEIGGGERLAPPEAKGIHHVRFEYGPEPFQTRLIDGEGQIHTYDGNALGLVTRYVNPLGHTRSSTYDALGRLLSIRDALGNVSRFLHDALGRPVGAVDADGGRTSIERDARGDVTGAVGPGGARWTVKRDAKGRVVERRGPASYVETFAHDERGLTTEATGPGSAWQMRYDAHGNLLERTSARGATWRLTHDLLGRLVALESPSGDRHELSYDSYGSLVEARGPCGQRTAIRYDGSRNVVASESDGSLTTRRFVGPAMVESAGADGAVTRSGYDALLRVRWVENAAGERHLIEYEPGGQVARERTFSGQEIRYAYDAASRLEAAARSGGIERRYRRDACGRVTAIERSDGRTDRFGRDDRGLLVSAVSEQVTVTYERDALGRVTRERQSATGWEFTVEHSSLPDDPVEVHRYSTGWSVGIQRGPELALRALGVEEGGELVEAVAFERDAGGREVRRARRDGSGVETRRDALGRPVEMRVIGPSGEPLRSRAYRWSQYPAVDAIEDSARGERRHELDRAGRPLRVRGIGLDEEFRYSPHGTPLPAGEVTELGAGGRVTRRGDVRYGWDAQGRLAQRITGAPEQGFTFSYDGDDRLIEAARGDGRVHRFLYDAFNRRIAAVGSDGTSTWFGWDGAALVEERSSTGGVVRRVLADDRYTPLLESAEPGKWRLIAADAVGAPWLLLDRDGAHEELHLSTWGHAASPREGGTRLRFAGQRFDPETGLVYHRHRYYVPEIAQFMTPDPLLGDGSFQAVGFVPNPTGYVDPLGLVILVGIPNNADLGLPKNKILKDSADERARVTGEKVVHSNELTPGSLSNLPKGEPVEIVSDAAMGRLKFDGTNVDGTGMANKLDVAGLEDGHPIYVVACNSGTPRGPAGKPAPSFIDLLHAGRGGKDPVYGVGKRPGKEEDDKGLAFVQPHVSPEIPFSIPPGADGDVVLYEATWYEAKGGSAGKPIAAAPSRVVPPYR